MFVPVGQHGGARKGVQSANLGQLGNDVFGDAVAQVFIFFHAAQIFEIQHHHGFHRLLGHPGLTVGKFGRAFAPGIQIAL